MILGGPMRRQALRFPAHGDPLDASAVWRSVGILQRLKEYK
jgi:hypothetical protein